MRIGFDARMILSTRRGLGRSAYLLLKYLLQIDKINSYYIFLDREDHNQEIPLAENATKIILPCRNYVIWEQFLLASASSKTRSHPFPGRDRADIYK